MSEWRFTLSADKAIFRAKTYSHIPYSWYDNYIPRRTDTAGDSITRRAVNCIEAAASAKSPPPP